MHTAYTALILSVAALLVVGVAWVWEHIAEIVVWVILTWGG